MTDEQIQQTLAERTTGNVQPGNRDRDQLAAFALMRARSRIEALEAENERLRKGLLGLKRTIVPTGQRDYDLGRKTSYQLISEMVDYILKGDSHE